MPIIANKISFLSTFERSSIFLASSKLINLTLDKSNIPLHKFLLVTKGTPLLTYLGVSCVPSLTSKQSPNRTHFQVDGISNGISSSVISGKALSFLILPSLMSFCFSAWILAYKTSADSSLASCGTSLP